MINNHSRSLFSFRPFILTELINQHRLYSNVINPQAIHPINQRFFLDLIGAPTGPVTTDAFESNDRLWRDIA